MSRPDMAQPEARYRRELTWSVARKWRRATKQCITLWLDADEVADLEALGVGNAIARRLAEYAEPRARVVVDPETLDKVSAADAAFTQLLRLAQIQRTASHLAGNDPWPDGPDAA